MKKRIIIATAFTACLALCAAVWPQTEKVGKTPAPSETAAVTTLQPTLPEPDELILQVITEKQESGVLKAESTPEVASEEVPIPSPEIEDDVEAEQESAPHTQTDSAPVQPTQPEPKSAPEPIANDNELATWSMSPALAGYKAKVPTMSSTPRICTRTAIKSASWVDLKN